MTLENLLIAFAYIVLALVLLLTVFTIASVKYTTWELRNQVREDQAEFEEKLSKKGLRKYKFESTDGPVTLWAINGKNALKKFKRQGLTQIHEQ